MGTSAAAGLTLGSAIRLGRVSNLPTVWTNVLAGAVLSGTMPRAGQILGLMLALSLFYVAGMYLNDAFDAKYDRLHRPSRPIPSGSVSVTAVFSMGGALLAAGLALLLVLTATGSNTSTLSLAFGLGLAALIVIYDAWHKGNPVGPVLMGACRLLVYLIASASIAGTVPVEARWAALVCLCYVIGLTYAAKQEDLLRPGSLWPLVVLAAPLVYAMPAALRWGYATIFYAGLLAVIIYAVAQLIWFGKARVSTVVTVLIAGICLLDAVLIASAGEPALATIAAIGFVLTLLLQRIVPGT